MAPKRDDAQDVPMLSHVADSLAPSPALRQLGRGTIIAAEKSDYMIDLDDKIIVKAVSETSDKGYQNDVDHDNSSFNSA
jgi:predicted amidohydrolase